MRSAVKIALVIGEQEAAILDGQPRIANRLYNRLLERANGLRQQYREKQDPAVGRQLYTERGLRDLIPALKEQHPFLKTVYTSPLKNAALRLSAAIRSYQDGKKGKRKKAVNWPCFRAWKRSWFSLQYSETARTNQAVSLHRGQSTLQRPRCGRHRGLCAPRGRHHQGDASLYEQ